MEKTFQVINTVNCKYVYLTEQKKLMSMVPMETVYNLETGDANQKFNLGGEGKLTQLQLNSQFYVSEESFKLGAPLSADHAIETCALVNIMEKLFPSYCVKEDEVGPFVWTYKNGEATKWRLEEHTKMVFIDHKDSKNNCIDGQLPKEVFESAEEVYMYNDYVVQDEDGKHEVREGVYRRLFLTDEQNALLDKLQAVIDECKEAGIAIDFNYAYYGVVAFNAKNIKEYGYEPFYDEEKEAAYYLDLSKAGRCMHNIGDYNTEDDSLKFVIARPCKD